MSEYPIFEVEDKDDLEVCVGESVEAMQWYVGKRGQGVRVLLSNGHDIKIVGEITRVVANNGE
jgi:hypothetical protein